MASDTRDKVMSTWASVMRQQLQDAATLASDANTSTAACMEVGRLLCEAATLLRMLAQKHEFKAHEAEAWGLQTESVATVAMLSLTGERTPKARQGVGA